MNTGEDTATEKPSASDPTSPPLEQLDRMDDFTQFQLKEYENISQAHFKTNEVLATFYRYYLLIAAIPISTVALAVMNLSDDGLGEEGRLLAYVIYGFSAVILSVIGVAVIAYIEGLRLDAILYARVVNSIRDFFFDKPGSDLFGPPVLPRDRSKPSYDGFGASLVIYFACAVLNAAIFASGFMALSIDRSVPLNAMNLPGCLWVGTAGMFLLAMGIQLLVRLKLISEKSRKGF